MIKSDNSPHVFEAYEGKPRPTKLLKNQKILYFGKWDDGQFVSTSPKEEKEGSYIFMIEGVLKKDYNLEKLLLWDIIEVKSNVPICDASDNIIKYKKASVEVFINDIINTI